MTGQSEHARTVQQDRHCRHAGPDIALRLLRFFVQHTSVYYLGILVIANNQTISLVSQVQLVICSWSSWLIMLITGVEVAVSGYHRRPVRWYQRSRHWCHLHDARKRSPSASISLIFQGNGNRRPSLGRQAKVAVFVLRTPGRCTFNISTVWKEAFLCRSTGSV